MAPKVNFHKNKGKMKLPTKPGTSSTENSDNTPSSAFNAEEFETELTWCIQQLQNNLKIKDMDEKGVKDITKAMKVLMSNNAPLVKKRQVMRMTFGDYKEKMKEQGRNKCNKRNMKIAPAKPSSKSKFLNKAKTLRSGSDSTSKKDENKENDGKFRFEKSDNSFRFNFTLRNT